MKDLSVVRFRRVSPVAKRSREGRLAEPKAGARSWRWGYFLCPLLGHSMTMRVFETRIAANRAACGMLEELDPCPRSGRLRQPSDRLN
jgi:hypothetical protein